ncbi:MAG: hypothetical protein JO029_14020 [Candidatus Eremiobacteraeota bacterium]|nr:hypothetical protein [Candidatus Eremiobacteraeota bacterium]
MPTIVRHDVAAADGAEHAALMRFTKLARAASSPAELEGATVDFLYERYWPVEVVQIIHADLDRKEFWTTTQRTAPGVGEFPTDPQPFSLVHDAEPVLVRGEIFTEHNIAAAEHAIMHDRQQKFGTGRFASAGVHAGTSVSALNVTQSSREPYSESEKYRLGLIAEIFALTLTSRC